MLGKKTPLTILFCGLILPALAYSAEEHYFVKSITSNNKWLLKNGQYFVFDDLVLPDKEFPDSSNQCFLNEMKHWLQTEIVSQGVLIDSTAQHKRIRNKPKYIKGKIRLKGRSGLRQELLKKGWASYKGLDQNLLKVQKIAQKNHLGIWGSCHIYKDLNKSLTKSGNSIFFNKHPQLLSPVAVGWVRSVLTESEIELYNGLRVKILGIKPISTKTDVINRCLKSEAKSLLEQLLLNKKVILEEDIYQPDHHRSVWRHIILPKTRYRSEKLLSEKLVSSNLYEFKNEKIKLRYRKRLLALKSLESFPKDLEHCFAGVQEEPKFYLIYDEKCRYKGNISESKKNPVKTYHTPLSGWYKRIKAEKCFEHEEDALLAGFIKVK